MFGAASVASAADVYSKGSYKDAPVADYAPPITWTGFYVGGHLGATFGDGIDVTVTGLGDDTLEIDNALTGGVHVGYNWQTPSNWVYGVEADLDFINDDFVDAAGREFDATGFLATIRGRLGYAYGNSLLYATGGVAFLEYDEGLAADTGVGYVVGAGFEHKLSDKFSIGLEGLYYDVSGDATVQLLNESLADADFDRDFWTVRARATYHFGSRYEEPLK